ncbi:MAG: diaminopimelate epimerase [Pseudomonadota bacterium]
MTRLVFHKMHGLGNDFVLIDERAASHRLTVEQLTHLADRRIGVGCDQVLVIGSPSNNHAQVSYRIYNADGSSAEHCGNGIRCVGRYLQGEEPHARTYRVEVGDEIADIEMHADGMVSVDMGVPDFRPAQIPLSVEHEQDEYALRLDCGEVAFGAVSMGNPHAVIEVDALDDAILEVAPGLQQSSLFPEQANIGFMKILDREHIDLRVYERGVGETLACGTGACAAVAVGQRWERLGRSVEVSLPGGRLQINANDNGRVLMTGPANYVFKGEIDL